MRESLETEVKNYLNLVDAHKVATEHFHQSKDAMQKARQELIARLFNSDKLEVAIYLNDYLHVLVLDCDGNEDARLHVFDYVPVINEGVNDEVQS